MSFFHKETEKETPAKPGEGKAALPYQPTREEIEDVAAAQNLAASRQILERLCAQHPFLNDLVDKAGGLDEIFKPMHLSKKATSKAEEPKHKR